MKNKRVVVEGTVWSYFEEGYIYEVVRDFASCKTDLERSMKTVLGDTLEYFIGKRVRVTIEEIEEEGE